MDYECPECGSAEVPHTISHFPPQIFECLNCGKKGIEKDFIKKDKPKFSSLPPPPPR